MTTTPDFRKSCAELVEKLNELNCNFNVPNQSALIERVLSELATVPPEPPADGEVAMLVARLKAIRNDYGVQHSADCQRAAELLERTATPPPEPPEPLTNMEIAAWADADSYVPYGYRRCFTEEEFGRTIRAALERWGHG